MDLEPTEDQQAILDLADQIVGDLCRADDLRVIEESTPLQHAALWKALVAADLVGISLPEAAGGGGYGLCEAGMVADVIGRYAAPVPYVDVVAVGRALAASGDAEASELAGSIIGGAVIVAALREGPDARETASPLTTAATAGDSWTLTGTKRMIPWGSQAGAYLVSARTGAETGDDAGGQVGLFIVGADDVAASEDSTTSSGLDLRSIELRDTPARRVATEDGLGALTTLLHELRILRSAQLGGIADGALALTAEHCKTREQFGSPIGTFQAVAHRMADSWLDVLLIRTTARQAAWRSDNDLPAVQAAASASMWACEASQRVVHAAQHVHGGIGVDLDYPVHRYFRWAKDLELQLGGAGACTRDLGAAIAAEPLTIG